MGLGGAAADASSAASSTFCAKDTAAFFPVFFVALPLCSLRCCQIPSDEVAALSRSCPTWCGTVGQISDICTRYEKHKKRRAISYVCGRFLFGSLCLKGA